MAIRVLPTHLVNKIAAGEVIERPASIVKELVENSLDASATRVEVAIEDGGRKLICVTDNGCGLGPEDLALAFAPHATSKLAGDDDLFRIATMGFRGEALASVASVSHAHVRTSLRPAEQGGPAAVGGHEVEASGQTLGPVRPCASAPGTTVTVRDLFFNTPARRKFLRNANTEAGHVAEQVTRLALPHPKVAFTLTHNGRTVYSLAPCETTLTRVGDLFGADLAEALLPITSRGGGPAVVSGLIGPPAAARGSGKWQYLFLNGRYIRDRLIGHAVREAYRGRVDANRWPVVFLFLEMDPGEVDVNVHPTKIEVRFQDSQIVHGEVLAALRETLNKANLAPTAALDTAAGGGESPAAQEERRASLRQALADFFRSAPPPQPKLAFPEDASPRRATPAPAAGVPGEHEHPLPLIQPPFSRPAPEQYTPAAPEPGPPAQAGAGAFASESPLRPPLPSAAGPDALSAPLEPAMQQASRFGAIQIHNAYLVAPSDDGLVIVDQHALHERLIYNDLRRRLAEESLTAQTLLIPETFPVTAAEADCLQNQADLLARLGIEVAPFGPDIFAVQRFPSMLVERRVPMAAFLREVLDKLAEDEAAGPEQILQDVLAVMACKAAVKAGDPLAPAEIDSLLARREAAEKGDSCPHGRPTTLKLSLRDLEKQFRRT